MGPRGSPREGSSGPGRPESPRSGSPLGGFGREFLPAETGEPDRQERVLEGLRVLFLASAGEENRVGRAPVARDQAIILVAVVADRLDALIARKPFRKGLVVPVEGEA